VANRTMKRKLLDGETLDVLKAGSPIKGQSGKYLLRQFEESNDYCDAIEEAWIWSIGRRHADGAIVTSTTVDMCSRDDYECIWRR